MRYSTPHAGIFIAMILAASLPARGQAQSRQMKLQPAHACARPATGAQAAPSTIEVQRPENNGSVNIVPCALVFNDGQRVTLSGGEQAVVSIRSGRSWVTAFSVDPYGQKSGDLNRWRSRRFRIHVGKDERLRLSVEPRSKDSAYTGGWII